MSLTVQMWTVDVVQYILVIKHIWLEDVVRYQSNNTSSYIFHMFLYVRSYD